MALPPKHFAHLTLDQIPQHSVPCQAFWNNQTQPRPTHTIGYSDGFRQQQIETGGSDRPTNRQHRPIFERRMQSLCGAKPLTQMTPSR
jgi:hypothetical protein